MAVSAKDIAAQVQTILDGTAGLAEEMTRADLAEVIKDSRVAVADVRPVVLVVGETKTGKSSLVNALLGLPNASPADAFAATVVPLSFSYATTNDAVIRYLDPAQQETHVPIDEVAEWATDECNPSNVRGVACIDIGVTAPVLSSLKIQLVDTPGTGGLNHTYAEATRTSLRKSDAIIFVCDADGEISGPELEYLRVAASYVETILPVMTFTDVFDDNELERVASATGIKLSNVVPRLGSAPPLPVRSLDVLDSLDVGPEDRARVQDASGLSALISQLQAQVTNRARLLNSTNVLRLCLTILKQLEAVAEERERAIQCDPRHMKALRAERSRLAQLPHTDWREVINFDIQDIEHHFAASVRDRLDTLGDGYNQRAHQFNKRDQFESAWKDFGREAQVVVQEVTEEATAGLLAVIENMIGQLEGNDLLLSAVESAGETPSDVFEGTIFLRAIGERLVSSIGPFLPPWA